MISKHELLNKAKEGFYKPEILEKVFKLLEVLQSFSELEFLKNRFVLKGGTALNLFYFNNLPRLSVDIDLNYIGSLSKEIMLEERPIIQEIILKILNQQGLTPTRSPTSYAGGKMVWRYDSILGYKGNLEIDLNYMYRQPLLDILWQSPNFKIHPYHDLQIPVLDVHELAAGKLTALFARRASRDLFDAHYLLTNNLLSLEKLRPIWVSYLSMSNIPLENIIPDYINYNLQSVHNELLPVLKQNHQLNKKTDLDIWLKKTLNELKTALSKFLPLKPSEIQFIKKVNQDAIIQPELITLDPTLITRIAAHPAILWAAGKKRS
ncbi:MAG: nucleotidyl transferase AbiEii/AbiGii toxin family protein [Gammaproteobacteria bacterium]